MLAKIKLLWRKNLNSQRRLTLLLGSSILYIVVFVLFYHPLGASITAFSILPTTLVAWYYGLRVGVGIGLLSFVLNTLLLNMVGQIGIGIVFETGGGPNFMSLMLTVVGIGKISEIHHENKQKQATLAIEHNLLATIVDHVPFDIFAKDTESRFIFANASTQKTNRIIHQEELIGKTDFDFMTQKLDEAQQHFDIEQEVIRTGESSLDHEFAGPNPEGRLIWAMGSKIPYYDISGGIVGVVGINRDITYRKEMEEAWRQSEENLRRALEAAKMRTWHWDLLQNQIVAKGVGLPGFSRTDYHITYQEFLEGVHSEDREMLRQAFDSLVEKGVSYDVEYRVISPDNTINWIASKGDVELNEVGKPIAVNGISFDITEHKEAEKHHLELTLERERIQLLANFITQASHEFRTPLSVINTSTYILGKTDDVDKKQQYLLQISQQVNNITLLIENFNTLSKLDSGQTIIFETINLNQMLQNIYMSKQGTHKDNSPESRLELTETPLLVYGDVDYLTQAIEHIWDNAIRYTSYGDTATIRSQLIDNKAVIEIEDTGIGISDDDLPHVFVRFYRADKSGTTRGFGLGLPIAKSIIEQLGGRIEVESTLGKGSLFRILMPIN